MTATQTTDADILAAWTAKTTEIAADNGWTLKHAQAVMLNFLRDTDPAAAATIAGALAKLAANCQAPTDDSNGIKVTSRATGHAYLAWAYGTSHMTARSFPLTPGDVGLTLTNERFAEEFQAASF